MGTKSASTTPATRLVVGVAVGLAVAGGIAVAGFAAFSLLGGWIVTALVYIGWTWADIWPMDASQTATHATREDPSRRVTHLLILVASVGSLVGVGFLLVAAPQGDATAIVAAGVAVLSATVSWFAVHTMFALHYAKAYYVPPVGGFDFHQAEPPRYSDFLYVAFTVGMSFAISDTDVGSSALRVTALGHALLSYVFGSVIIASIVNLVAGLS